MASKAFYENSLSIGIKRLPTMVSRAALFVLAKNAAPVENYMKTNAPWTDRTTNARNGLATRVVSDRKTHSLVLFHQVPYGIWLEINQEGKNGIILPTMQEQGPRLMKEYAGLLDRIHVGGG